MIKVDVKCLICGGFICEQTPVCLPVKEEPKVEEKEPKLVEEPKVEEPKVEEKPKAKKAAKKSKK